jgi:hypothetical protein
MRNLVDNISVVLSLVYLVCLILFVARKTVRSAIAAFTASIVVCLLAITRAFLGEFGGGNYPLVIDCITAVFAACSAVIIYLTMRQTIRRQYMFVVLFEEGYEDYEDEAGDQP